MAHRLLGARLSTAGTTTFRVWAPEHASVDLVVEAAERVPPPRQCRRGAGSSGPSIVPSPTRRAATGRGGVRRCAAGHALPLSPRRPRRPGLSRSRVALPAGGRARPVAGRRSGGVRVDRSSVAAAVARRDSSSTSCTSAPSRPRARSARVIDRLPVAGGPRRHGHRADAGRRLPRRRATGATTAWRCSRRRAATASPDDLRALVDAAHRHGLAVFLDVVYNHLGPDGAYANVFSPHYFTDRASEPVGPRRQPRWPAQPRGARVLHRERAALGRTSTTSTACASTPRTPCRTTARALPRRAHHDACATQPGGRSCFVAEDHRNLAQMLRPAADGRLRARRRLGRRLPPPGARAHRADREGYYARLHRHGRGPRGDAAPGLVLHGPALAVPRTSRAGTDPSATLADSSSSSASRTTIRSATAPTARGCNHEVDAATFRALSALLLLAPQTPLLFMGQEWAASSPFLFFTDHDDGARAQGHRGAARGVRRLRGVRRPGAARGDPRSAGAETFERSRLRLGRAHSASRTRGCAGCISGCCASRRQRRAASRAPPRRRPRARRALADADAAQAAPSRRASISPPIVRLSGAGAVVVPAPGRHGAIVAADHRGC